MRQLLYCIFCLTILLTAKGQRPTTVTLLSKKHQQASNDSFKILALEELADYYYTFRSDKKGDSIVQMQLEIAEQSDNKRLRLFALLSNSVTNVSPWSTGERLKKTLKYIDEGLRYAENINSNQYVVLAHIRKASVYRKSGDYDKAIEEANLAFLTYGDVAADSLKAILYLELGDIYQEKKDAINAYKCFNHAFQISYGLKDLKLQSAIYRYLAKFYRSINEKDLAKENLKKSLEIDKQLNDEEAICIDNLELAKLTDEKIYYDKGLEIAAKINSEKIILQSRIVMFAYFMTVDTNFLAMQYFRQNPDLEQYHRNQGIGNYYFTLGNVYHFDRTHRHPDSAVYYYALAEREMKSIYEKNSLRAIYFRLGESYAKQGSISQAIACYEKALLYARMIGDIKPVADYTLALSKLYSKTNEVAHAYDYLVEYNKYRDSLVQLTNNRQLVFLEIEKDRAKEIEDQKEEALRLEKVRNLQYMGITIAIATVFILLLLFGMFPISKFTIRALSFFAFICLFEFIIVLIDGYLYHKFHGDTLSIWLTKIVIIAMLMPLHHLLEHAVVHFLESKKLQALRSRLSVKKLWASHKRQPVMHTENEMKEDTAVL